MNIEAKRKKKDPINENKISLLTLYRIKSENKICKYMQRNIQVEKYWKFSGKKNLNNLKTIAKRGIESE